MSSFDEYMKARGHKPAHPEVKEILEKNEEMFQQHDMPQTFVDDRHWKVNKDTVKHYSMVALVLSLVGALGYEYYKPEKVLLNEVDKPLIQEPRVVYKRVEVPVEVPKYIYKTKTKVKYIKDPAYDSRLAEMEQHYKRRMRMMQEFYAKPLGPGETRRLVFESNCPGFDNNKYMPTTY